MKAAEVQRTQSEVTRAGYVGPPAALADVRLWLVAIPLHSSAAAANGSPSPMYCQPAPPDPAGQPATVLGDAPSGPTVRRALDLAGHAGMLDRIAGRGSLT